MVKPIPLPLSCRGIPSSSNSESSSLTCILHYSPSFKFVRSESFLPVAHRLRQRSMLGGYGVAHAGDSELWRRTTDPWPYYYQWQNQAQAQAQPAPQSGAHLQQPALIHPHSPPAFVPRGPSAHMAPAQQAHWKAHAPQAAHWQAAHWQAASRPEAAAIEDGWSVCQWWWLVVPSLLLPPSATQTGSAPRQCH